MGVEPPKPGRGRKPADPSNSRNVPKAIKVSQQIADYLKETGTGIIEDTLRQTEQFKEWAKK